MTASARVSRRRVSHDENFHPMVSFIGGLLLLFLVLRAIKAFGRMSPAFVARWAKRGGWFLIVASLAYLGFAGRSGLMRLFGLGLGNAFKGGGADPLGEDFFASGGARNKRSSVVRSAWIEMHLEYDTGGMRGFTLAGPYAGRELGNLSRDESLQLFNLCRRQDPEGARLLETYFDRRFAGWREADQGQSEAGGNGGRSGPRERRDVARRSV